MSPDQLNALKTHCLRGHEFTHDNTFVVKATGHRQCRTCIRLRPADKVRSQRDRRTKLKRKYGMTESDLQALLSAQDGRCAICRVTLNLLKQQSGETAHIDHDHATGKVRGVLCMRCNTALGYFRDSSATLIAAAAYLRRNSEGAMS